MKGCAKCAEVKPGGRRHTHIWPAEDKPWARVHMDHGHIPDVGLLLILVDAFSGWPEVVRVPDRSAQTVKGVLREIFSRNGVPNVLVSDNAAEFHDRELCEWLQQIGCRPLKTPPYHPESNGAAERMVQTVKRGIRAFDKTRSSFCAYLAKLLLSYRTIPHAGRSGSPSALMGRQLRSPLTTKFESDAQVWYRPTPMHVPVAAKFVVQEGNNTAIIVKGREEVPVLAHFDQLCKQPTQVEVLPGAQESVMRPVEETVPAAATDAVSDTDQGVATNGVGLPRRSTRINFGKPPDRLGYLPP